MTDADGWLSKSEVNALYYDAVEGQIVFGTEAQADLHAEAVARLVTVHAEGVGRSQIRILELGANDATFARSLLELLRRLERMGQSSLERVDYLAVDYARRSLETAVDRDTAEGGASTVFRPTVERPGAAVGSPGRPGFVALLARQGRPATNLGLVHADAIDFVETTRETFDIVIMNELLDDLAWTPVYTDDSGRSYELVASARSEGETWIVRVEARRRVAGDSQPSPPPRTLTAGSEDTTTLAAGAAGLLRSQGLLVVHDYGFAGPFARLATYESLPPLMPAFAALELPEAAEHGFPRSFFRVFASERQRLIQITNDLNFAVVGAALASTGAVITLPHGNALANDRAFTGFERGEGVFLGEFGLLRPGDDVPVLLRRLEQEQATLRERYIRDRMGGRESLFMDLVYLKR